MTCLRAISLRQRIRRPAAKATRAGSCLGFQARKIGLGASGALRYPCGRVDRWPSGRRRTPGKCVTANPVRGFESHPVRQDIRCERAGRSKMRVVMMCMVGSNPGSTGRSEARARTLERSDSGPERSEGFAAQLRTIPPCPPTIESMVARVCIFATTGHEPRQARKGAAVVALSRAPKSCWRGPPPINFAL
jgi:hypothetical protein